MIKQNNMLITCPLLHLAINSFADLHSYDDTVASSSKHLFHLPPFSSAYHSSILKSIALSCASC